jgi:hypothetical protein
MSAKRVFVSSFLGLVLGLIPAQVVLGISGGVDPSLVGWWKLDDGSGATASDSSGSGYQGEVQGGATWTVGKIGGAMQFNGSNAYVRVPHIPFDNRSFTIAIWVNPTSLTGQQIIFSQTQARGTDTSLHLRLCGPGATYGPIGGLRMGFYGDDLDTPTNIIQNNTWYHLTCSYDYENRIRRIYVNGVQSAQGTSASPFLGTTGNTNIGCWDGTEEWFNGMLDEVRVYKKALTVDEVQIVMKGYTTPIASNPNPKDKATDVVRDAVLSWKPGPVAKTHDVYFGTIFDDVNAADRANPKGLLVSQNQDANSYDPAGLFAFGQTCYWRIDEVNGAPDFAVVKGEIWTFTAEPFAYKIANITATASSTATGTSPQSTVDGSGLDANDLHATSSATMWTTAKGASGPAWIQYDFDRVYKMHEMWLWNYNFSFESLLGFGIKKATITYSADGVNWKALGDYEFADAPGEPGYAHNATVDFGGIAVKQVRITANSNWGVQAQYGLSEVRFYYIPAHAREPKPATGATGVSPDVTLSWRAGRQAVTHQVYTGTDPNVLTLAGTVPASSYTPAGLTLGMRYYWRIDEVNNAEPISTWTGDVWNLTVADYVVIDDMASYNDSSAPIFNFWKDGYSTSTNGSVVGLAQPANGTFCETTIVHSGKQSMPFAYGNITGVAVSEATRTFDVAQDWTRAEIKTLVLYFYGLPDNGAGQLYVKINSTKIAYSGDAGNIQRRRWNQWNIDLASVGASARAVNTLTIGVSSTGKGTLYIDDIRLYRLAPEIPVAVNPGNTGLIAWYAMSNNVQDGSGNGNNGTLVGTPTYAAGLGAFGTALKLNGATDAVNLGNKPVFNPAGSFSVSLWAYSTLWGTQWGHVMVANRGESNVGWQIRKYNTTTSMCFTTRGVGNDDMQSVGAMPQSEWVHIACVYDNAANTKRIYINGVLDSELTTTAATRIAATTHNTYIGARADSGNTGTEAWFMGMLDEVRLFSRALSAGEVEYLSDPTP